MRRRRRAAVKFMRLSHAEGLPLPAYQSVGAAGFDLHAAVPGDEPLVLEPGRYSLVPTGFAMALPKEMEAQVRPRSGLAVKHGITVLNSPGTIDADYRGEVAVILINLGSSPFVIERGDRIAQMVVAPVSQVRPVEVARLASTARGSGGFGSTGGKREPEKKGISASTRPTKTKTRPGTSAKKRAPR